MQTTLLILPNFVLILVGLALARAVSTTAAGSGKGSRRSSISCSSRRYCCVRSPFHRSTFAGIGIVVGCGWAIMLLGMALAALARPLFRIDARVAASCFQCAFRFNTYIGLAVAGSLFGAPGVATAALLMGALIPLANSGRGGNARGARANEPLARARAKPPHRLHARRLCLEPVRNGMPGFLDQTLNLLGQAALPAGLLAVGAALRIEHGEASLAAHAWWLGVKLAVMPLAAWACVALSGALRRSRPGCWCCGRHSPPPRAPTSSPCAWAETGAPSPRRSRPER